LRETDEQEDEAEREKRNTGFVMKGRGIKGAV
jgi:hypothetical protein